ncbi:MAG: hypothetical protein EBX50_01320 [Chitinophagia bacterium]|nr:hypothetical protein [Chitinophagia bacterium]
MPATKINIENFVSYDNKEEKLNVFKSLFDAKYSLKYPECQIKSENKNKDILKSCKFKPINKEKLNKKRKGL